MRERGIGKSDEQSHAGREWLLVLGSFIAINLLSFWLQPRFSFMGGHVWEQATYYDIARHFQQGLPIVGPAPAIFRVGVPWLTSLLPFRDLTDSFFAVDLVANLAAIVLLVLWLRLFVSRWGIRVSLVLCYMLHWLAPTRFDYYVAANVDALGFAFILAGLYFSELFRRVGGAMNLLCVLAISSVGIFVRETVLIVPVVFVLVSFGRQRSMRSILSGVLPFVASTIVVLWLRSSVTVIGPYNFLGAAINWAYSKPFPGYILGWFVAFGPAIALLALDWNRTLGFLRANVHLGFVLAAFAVLAYAGGSDTERILLWASPVVLVLIGSWFERNIAERSQRLIIGVLLVFQLLSERVIFQTPDVTFEQHQAPVLLTSLSNTATYFNLFSYHASRSVGTLMLVEYLALGLLFVVIFRRVIRIGSTSPLSSNSV